MFAMAIALASGCGEREPVEPAEGGPLTVRLSMLFPRRSIYHRGAEEWERLVGEESGGEMAMEVYPGGELLSRVEGDQLGLLESGAAELAVVRPSELAHVSPSLEVLYLPFLFANRRSADAVLESEVGRKPLEGLEKGGIVGLGYFSGPFLQLSSTRRVVVPEDMGGLRVRLPGFRSRRIDGEAMRLLGVESVDVALDDLKPASAAGRIDGQVSTLDQYNMLDVERWQEHVTMLNYSFEPLVICSSSAFWDGMSLKQREILVSTLRESARYQRELLVREERRAREKLYGGGSSVVELIPEELERFRKVVEKKYAAMAPGVEEALIAAVKEEADKNREPYLYRFYDELGSARVEAPPYTSEAYPGEKLPARGEGSALAHIGDAYDFDERYGIFCPVPSRLEYEVVVPPNAKLEFGIGVRPSAHEQFPPGAGVTFAVDVESGGGLRRVYERTLDPMVKDEEKQWVDERLDIDSPLGERARIVFSAESVAQNEDGERMYYGAIWTNPVLYEEDVDTCHRNVILISIDTLRADALGCYGNRHAASPNIDGMAGEGTMFDNCISQDTWTLPSHMSIMTSLYPSAHNMTEFWCDRQVGLSPGYLTLAEVMRDNGYNTIAFAESGLVDSIYGFKQGFNSYSNFWTFTDQEIHPERAVARDDGVVRLPPPLPVSFKHKLSGVVRSTNLTFSRAVEWLKSRGRRKFFCFIHTYEVHIPYFRNPYVRLFDPLYTGIVPDTLTYEKVGEICKEAYSGGNKVLSERDEEHLWALYSAQVRFTDDFIGLLLDAIKAANLDHDTLVLFASDHGERLYSHGVFIDHGGSPHDALVKVPLIVRCDSIIPRDKKILQQVASLDIFPTVLDFTGCSKPAVLEGMSLYPSVVEGAPLQEKRPVYVEDNDRIQRGEGENRIGWRIGMRLDGKKFIYYPSTGYRELFDLFSDPGEVENIAETSEEAERMEKMVQSFIRRRPYGYYLVFTEEGAKHTFKGQLTVDGVFMGVYAQGIRWWYQREASTDSWFKRISFKTESDGVGMHVLNFVVHPEDAQVTLDLRVDGKRQPAIVFLGDSMGHPEELPWKLDSSIRTARNPYSVLASSARLGCYVSRVDSPYLVDEVQREGLRVVLGERPRLEEAGPAVPDKERVDRAREQLKALGYIQ